MISYWELFLPSLILMRAFYNFSTMYKLISDKGELYHIFKKDWKSYLLTAGGALIAFIMIFWFGRDRIDFSSFHIYSKYFESPFMLFDRPYYNALYEKLIESNSADLDALKAMKTTMAIFPSMLALFTGLISDFPPYQFSAGVYANGIFDGKVFYQYDTIKTYTIENEDKKPILKLTLYKKSAFSQDHKEASISVAKDEVTEVISYLRHEIRSETDFESSTRAYN